MRITTAIALFVVILASCLRLSLAWSPLNLNPTVKEIADGYRSYRKLTNEMAFTNPELAALCIGVNKEQVEKARIKHGPHAHAAILVYMNDLAAQSFPRNASSYPIGAVIVKEKHLLSYRDSVTGAWGYVPTATQSDGVGGMVKRSPGFDPTHGDWEYFYFEKSSKIESGRISSCVQCHEGAKSTDYVFGTWNHSVFTVPN